MNNQEIMLRCTEVNLRYMRLPAGSVDGLNHLTELYKSLAKQSLDCAAAWVAGNPCPVHEPAVNAFWWGVVEWADAFGNSVGIDKDEWGKVFIHPHLEFASYLFPGQKPGVVPSVGGTPAEIILRLDSIWMEKVIMLTSKWGLLRHLKDKDALTEAQQLGKLLRDPESDAYKAYLKSDLHFFKALFLNFPFSQGVQKQLDGFITRAEEAL